ncbi:tetratricopeptide (TPR) repeat protein [Caulobacter ginsengisoli]|uniref:Tetratricopeptide (TPR) repeat protein n=1 Tax=Caulobacter ginsengisoli TaxID=400775 RepID=A0ABU0IUU4_9CAUL|nr:tetratricopeptide repeat protein [Caulobacter ginsengisoli]MDQ0465787.1 tetratricopeptide (TPR) repeat protein [Caulobacter ginsengisoli]
MSGKSRWVSIALTVAAGLVLASPGAALARAKGDPAAIAGAADFAALDAQEAADAKIVQSALKTLIEERGPGLKRKLPQIRAVLARAPAVYPLVEKREGGLIIVRSDNLALGLVSALTGGGGEGQTTVEQRFNTYIYAAYILGWYANETRHAEDALEPLAKGLALQPGNAMLTGEQNAALIVLRRFPEALAANDLALAQPFIDDVFHAQLLRNRGYVLIELGRMDEAETAYNESLKLAPGNRTALSELEFIRQRRAGMPPVPGAGPVMYTGDKPTPGQTPPPADDGN